MIFNSFYFQIILRIIFLFCNGLLIFIIWPIDGLAHLKFALFALIPIQCILLLHFINKINRKLTVFFEAVKRDDYNIRFQTDGKEKDFSELNRHLADLADHMRKTKIENAMQDQYFKALIEHIGIGVFAFNEDGKVRFFNSALSELLKFEVLKSIDRFDYFKPGLSHFFKSLKPGIQQQLSVDVNGNSLKLAVKATINKFGEEFITLVSLQNISYELNRKETETWQKTIRILTHEIVNSVSPITSVAGTLSTIVTEKDGDTSLFTEKDQNKIAKGLSTIQNRGKGLLEFVQHFRKLTLIPEPKKNHVIVKNLFNEIMILFEEDYKSLNIAFVFIKNTLADHIYADKEQIEQVLINLVKNAIWAVNDISEKRIEFVFNETSEGQKKLIVRDNGVGISTEIQEEIFIPFYSKRENGSGIGLSLSRQIMYAHEGSLEVSSKLGEGSSFILTFKE
jgi:nitrogen fixation/metabolism regulation signal transduction histidine kinase